MFSFFKATSPYIKRAHVDIKKLRKKADPERIKFSDDTGLADDLFLRDFKIDEDFYNNLSPMKQKFYDDQYGGDFRQYKYDRHLADLEDFYFDTNPFIDLAWRLREELKPSTHAKIKKALVRYVGDPRKNKVEEATDLPHDLIEYIINPYLDDSDEKIVSVSADVRDGKGISHKRKRKRKPHSSNKK